jgi:hypothetical protein
VIKLDVFVRLNGRLWIYACGVWMFVWDEFGVQGKCILLAFMECSLIEYALAYSTVRVHHTGY